MIRIRPLFLAGVLLWPLLGCDNRSERAALPMPAEPDASSIAHFCNMAVLDHPGPKGQIFLKDRQDPIWFSSVRDTLAFTMLPEESKAITAIYVNDMAKARDWQHPEPGSWVDAHSAWFVLGSDYDGGMGGREAVPFSAEAAARDFAARHGGRLSRFSEIPQSYVLEATVDENSAPEGKHDHHHGGEP
jgi:copper chaperone NosL